MQSRVIKCNNEEFIETTYNEISVIVDSNGYYQASKICKDNKKKFYDWKRLDRTQELLKIYSKRLKLSIERSSGNSRDFKTTYLINKRLENYTPELQGNYIHPKLVHHLCEWCNLEYAIIVGEIMDSINEQTHLRNITLKTFNEELKQENENLKQEIKGLNNKINLQLSIINNKCVNTRTDSRKFRIYDITQYKKNQQQLNPFDDKCIWKVSGAQRNKYKYPVLLEVVLVSSMHARIDIKQHLYEETINKKLIMNLVKQSSKEYIYKYVINDLKPKRIVRDDIKL